MAALGLPLMASTAPENRTHRHTAFTVSIDARRGTTDVSEIIEASLEKRSRASLAQIFDFESRYVNVDGVCAPA